MSVHLPKNNLLLCRRAFSCRLCGLIAVNSANTADTKFHKNPSDDSALWTKRPDRYDEATSCFSHINRHKNGEGATDIDSETNKQTDRQTALAGYCGTICTNGREFWKCWMANRVRRCNKKFYWQEFVDTWKENQAEIGHFVLLPSIIGYLTSPY